MWQTHTRTTSWAVYWNYKPSVWMSGCATEKHEQLSLLMASSKVGPIIHCHRDSSCSSSQLLIQINPIPTLTQNWLETHSTRRDRWHPFAASSYPHAETWNKRQEVPCLGFAWIKRSSGLAWIGPARHAFDDSVWGSFFASERSHNITCLCWIALF